MTIFLASAALSGCVAVENRLGWQGEVSAARQLLQFDERGRAFDVLDSVLEQYSNNSTVLTALGELYLEYDAILRARAAYTRLEQAGQPIEAQLGLGRVALKTNSVTDARTHLNAVLAADPARIEALNAFGVSHDIAGSHQTAQQFYQRALALDPGYQEAHNNLAFSLLLSRDFNHATARFEQLVQSYLRNRTYKLNLAVAYYAKNDSDSASRLELSNSERSAARELAAAL
ncbi:tetratricopeptide repeat protein [uncultured Tateyamaria sp.]|uniref:tetratricopeptide repeat protein n=1 Tax=uncultured Tateyamaria sp. TaxID=455651 RepID=UPI002610899D|nr:tetratricopeptide repeat protein [uncultured Tateyamaria sp.]